MSRLELVSVAEIAALAGVKPGTVIKWRQRGLLPAPVATLQAGNIWRRRDIERWLAER